MLDYNLFSICVKQQPVNLQYARDVGVVPTRSREIFFVTGMEFVDIGLGSWAIHGESEGIGEQGSQHQENGCWVECTSV